MKTFLVRERLNVQLLTPCLGFEVGGPHELVESAPPLQALGAESSNWCSEQLLVLQHLLVLSSKGSDVWLNTGAMVSPLPGKVQSVQANLWRLAFKWQWQLPTPAGEKQQQDDPGKPEEEHINALELRALLTATRWALRSYRSVV